MAGGREAVVRGLERVHIHEKKGDQTAGLSLPCQSFTYLRQWLLNLDTARLTFSFVAHCSAVKSSALAMSVLAPRRMSA